MKGITPRQTYLRPIIVAISLSVVAEFGLLVLFGMVLFPEGSLFHKFLWTIVFCGLGMGSVLGAAISLFIVDKLKGKAAILSCVALSFVTLGIFCDQLCLALDRHFQYFGGASHGWVFSTTSWILSSLGGALAGWLLFTEAGSKLLSKLGI